MKNRFLVFVFVLLCVGIADAKEPVDESDQRLFAPGLTRKEQALAFTARARELFVEALGHAGWDSDDIAYGFVRLVEIEIKLDDLSAARKTVASIPKQLVFHGGYYGGFLFVRPRDQVLDLIAKSELNRGNLDPAAQTASAITYEPPSGYEPGLKNDFPDRRGIILAVVQKLIETQHYEHAIEVARKLVLKTSNPGRSKWTTEIYFHSAIRPIFVALVAAGKSSQARALARSLLSDAALLC